MQSELHSLDGKQKKKKKSEFQSIENGRKRNNYAPLYLIPRTFDGLYFSRITFKHTIELKILYYCDDLKCVADTAFFSQCSKRTDVSHIIRTNHFDFTHSLPFTFLHFFFFSFLTRLLKCSVNM